MAITVPKKYDRTSYVPNQIPGNIRIEMLRVAREHLQAKYEAGVAAGENPAFPTAEEIMDEAKTLVPFFEF